MGQQLTGINFFMGYGPSIFTGLCIMDGYIAQIILTFFNVLGTIPGLLMIDHGRKKVLLAGTLGIVFSFFAATLLVSSVADMSADGAWAGWFVFGLVLIFQVSFASTWGIVGWTVPAEVFPTPLRGKGAGLATAANQGFNYIMVQLSPVLLTSFGLAGGFGFFLAVNVLFVTPYVIWWLPETANVSLERLGDFVFPFTFYKQEKRNETTTTTTTTTSTTTTLDDSRHRRGTSVSSNNRFVKDSSSSRQFGTIREFMKRNGRQSIDATLCRPIRYGPASVGTEEIDGIEGGIGGGGGGGGPALK